MHFSRNCCEMNAINSYNLKFLNIILGSVDLRDLGMGRIINQRMLSKTIMVLAVVFAISGMMIPTSAFAIESDMNNNEGDFNAAMGKYKWKNSNLVNFGSEKTPLYYQQIVYAREMIDAGPIDAFCAPTDPPKRSLTISTGITNSTKSIFTTKVVDFTQSVLGVGFEAYGFNVSGEFTKSLQETKEDTLESQQIKTTFNTVTDTFTAKAGVDYVQHYYKTDKEYEIRYIPSGITSIDQKVKQMYDAVNDKEDSEIKLAEQQKDFDKHYADVKNKAQSSTKVGMKFRVDMAERQPTELLKMKEYDKFTISDIGIHTYIMYKLDQIEKREAHIEQLEENLETWSAEIKVLVDDVDETDFEDEVAYGDLNKKNMISQSSRNGVGQYSFNVLDRPCVVVRSGDVDTLSGDGATLPSEDYNLDNFIPLGEIMAISVSDNSGSHPNIQVTDDNYYAVEGATVDINGITAMTDEFGVASFDIVLEEDGYVKIKATHPDYPDNSIIVNFSTILDDESDSTYEKFVAETSTDEADVTRGGMDDLTSDVELICVGKVFIENKKGRIACVTPSTGDKLVERGWGTLLEDSDETEQGMGGATQTANPASVFCIDNGGTLTLQKDEAGTVSGMCTLSDGTECGEWEYFRGECP